MRTELLREVLAHRLTRSTARKIDRLMEERRHRVIVKALVNERIRCRMTVLLRNIAEFLDA